MFGDRENLINAVNKTNSKFVCEFAQKYKKNTHSV